MHYAFFILHSRFQRAKLQFKHFFWYIYITHRGESQVSFGHIRKSPLTLSQMRDNRYHTGAVCSVQQGYLAKSSRIWYDNQNTAQEDIL